MCHHRSTVYPIISSSFFYFSPISFVTFNCFFLIIWRIFYHHCTYSNVICFITNLLAQVTCLISILTILYSKTCCEQPLSCKQPLSWAANHSMGGRLVIPQNDISYTSEHPMDSNLPWKANFQVPQGWLLIALNMFYSNRIRYFYKLR